MVLKFTEPNGSSKISFTPAIQDSLLNTYPVPNNHANSTGPIVLEEDLFLQNTLMSGTMEVKQNNVSYEVNESVNLKSDLNHVESVDGIGNGHTLGSTLLVTIDGQVRRIPVSTNDPNDPLNFSRWQKVGIVFSCCWFCKSPSPF